MDDEQPIVEQTVAEERLAPPAAVFCSQCGAVLEPAIACACLTRHQTLTTMAAELQTERKSLKVAIMLYAALLLVSIIGTGVSLVAGEKAEFAIETAITLAFAVITLGFAIACWRQLAPAYARTGRWFWSVLAPVGALLTFAVSTVTLTVLSKVAGLQELRVLPPFYDAGYGFGMAMLVVAVMPAIVEEAAFRGVIFAQLRRVLSPAETIFVTAGMFAMLHLSPISLPHLFIMGVALAFLRERTGSIYPGMILHFVHNSLCLIAEQAGQVA